MWPNVMLEATAGVKGVDVKHSLAQCGLMPCLEQFWCRFNAERNQELHQSNSFVDSKQQFLFSLFSDYRNVFYPLKRYPTKEEGFDKDVVLDAVALHCVRHVRASKERLQSQIDARHRAKQRKKELKDETPYVESDREIDGERIFGFTFPKVLILVPMRNAAYNVVRRILHLASPDQPGLEKVMEKLQVNYGPDDALEAAFKRQKKVERGKPPDYDAIFYGHVSDAVTIGIKMHLNGHLSVFRPLSESDIFIASPLSLSLLLEKKPQEITDQLSSIELLVVDRADVMLMQNWRHLLRVIHRLNRMPHDLPTDVNVLQIRHHFLQDQAPYFRQTILLSSFPSAEMHALFNGPLCRNYAGRLLFRPLYPGLLHARPLQKITHRFERHDCQNIQSAADARFDAFRSSLLDFMRVVDCMGHEGIDIGALSEYTGALQGKRLRRRFRDGAVRILVITERFYFYNRPSLKGIQSLYFYSLPDHVHFYTELLDKISPGSHVWIMFSRFSSFQLERLVGSGSARRMMTDRRGVITEVL